MTAKWHTGVYCWFNVVTRQRLIGSAARSLDRRRKEYLWRLAKGTCHNQHFQRSWNKYGSDAFVWCVIERCPPDKCTGRETYWIKRHKATDNRFGYNICHQGRSQLGTRLQEEHKKKIGASNAVALLGRKASDTHRAAISAALTGKKKSTAHAAAIAKAKTGTTHTVATRAVISAKLTGRPGAPHTAASRKKIGDGVRAAAANRRALRDLFPSW